MKAPTLNILLRLAAISAAIPIIWLRADISSRPVGMFLTLAFYTAPNIAIAICPIKWERFQIGLGIGYSLSMIVALQIYLRASAAALIGMPSTPPTEPLSLGAYNVAMIMDVILLLTSAVVLVGHRRQLGDLFVLTLSFMGGLAYPFLAFVLIAVLVQI
jgi:hypothetical protein